MTNKGGTVTFDAEEYLKLLDEMTALEKRLRNLGREGYKVDGMTTKPSSPASREKEEEAMEIDLDISGIEWKLSNRDGGGLAGPEAGWSWAFSTTRDGGVRRECMALVQAIELYGTVRIDQYEIGLGGRNGNLLNRTKVKKDAMAGKI